MGRGVKIVLCVVKYCLEHVTPALVQDAYWFKEYKSRGLLNVGETPALLMYYTCYFMKPGPG